MQTSDTGLTALIEISSPGGLVTSAWAQIPDMTGWRLGSPAASARDSGSSTNPASARRTSGDQSREARR